MTVDHGCLAALAVTLGLGPFLTSPGLTLLIIMNTMGPPPVKPTERPPLITPSASPPPSRFNHRNPDSDGPSPTKRQRLFSTPRLTLPVSSASSSVSRPQTPIDVQKEREASKLRLLDVWAGLAERYNVPVEDDDLVNIRTGKITKDNGFLRKHKTLDFGTITAPTLGPDDEASEDEDEDDIDELDAFADENQSEEEEEGDSQSAMKPPGFSNPFASILQAAEEEDLRQFLQAEQERKALCGSDVDDYEEDECSSEEYASSSKPEGGTESDLESSVEPDFQNDEPGLEQGMTGGEEYGFEQIEERVEAGQSQQDIGRTADLPIPLDFDSEDDELDIWVQDESCIVYPVVKAEPPEHHLSTGEGDDIAEPPAILTHSPPVGKPSNKQNMSTKPSIYPKSIKGSQQLYTPPQSQSSSRSSAAPIIDIIDLSSSTESLPPPSAFASLKNSKGKSTKSKSKIPVAIQHSVGQKSNRKHVASKESATISPDLSNKTAPNTKLQPYVLLTPRHGRHGTTRSDPPSGKTPAQTDGLSSEEELPEHANSSPSKASKGKGKAKAVDSLPGPHNDVRRGTTHLKNATTSNNNHGGAVQILSNGKTKFSAQDHKDPSLSKTRDAKQRTGKPSVASNNEHAKGPPALPSTSTHRKRKRTSVDSKTGTSASPTRESDLDNSIGNANDLGHSSSHTSTSRVTLGELLLPPFKFKPLIHTQMKSVRVGKQRQNLHLDDGREPQVQIQTANLRQTLVHLNRSVGIGTASSSHQSEPRCLLHFIRTIICPIQRRIIHRPITLQSRTLAHNLSLLMQCTNYLLWSVDPGDLLHTGQSHIRLPIVITMLVLPLGRSSLLHTIHIRILMLMIPIIPTLLFRQIRPRSSLRPINRVPVGRNRWLKRVDLEDGAYLLILTMMDAVEKW